ncbi:MAG: hypothetical protein LHV69_07015 [Elusimicrobia bacterium]|nr:hypothetical protein [Candidatus Obscuribacterium magneticum]
MERKKHWETIYETKSPTEVSWYQLHPTKSLEFIRGVAPDQNAQIIDIGGGASTLLRSLKPKGDFLIATFASDGPPRCSGLDVVRYSVEVLQQEFGKEFQLIKSMEEVHQTPFETEQKFIYCHFQRK